MLHLTNANAPTYIPATIVNFRCAFPIANMVGRVLGETNASAKEDGLVPDAKFVSLFLIVKEYTVNDLP